MSQRSAVSIAQEVYSSATELRNSIEEFAGRRVEGATYEVLKTIDSSFTEDRLIEVNKERIREKLSKHESKLEELKEALKREGTLN